MAICLAGVEPVNPTDEMTNAAMNGAKVTDRSSRGVSQLRC